MALKVNPWFVECGGTMSLNSELPNQIGHKNHVLHTDGQNTYWAFVDYNRLLNTPTIPTSNTFSNGLTESSGAVSLGGSIISNTIISSITSRDIEIKSGDGTDYSWIKTVGATKEVVVGAYEGSTGDVLTVVINANKAEITDEINSKGLVYKADYSTNWTDHSLVTKKWVTDNFSSGGTSYTADTPLVINGSNVISLEYLSTQFLNSSGKLTLKFGTSAGVAAEGNHGHSAYSLTSHTHDGRYYTKVELQTNGFASINWNNIDINVPTTLSGYGITDATPISHVGTGGSSHAVVTLSTNGFMDHVAYTQLTYDVIRKAKIILSTTTWNWNFHLGFNAEGTIIGDTLLNITNVSAGDYGTITILNPAASYTLTLPAGSIQVGGGGNTVSLPGSSSKDLLSFYYNGVNYFWSVTTSYS